MTALWAQAPSIVAFTGAGLAREAGFAPFAPETMPEGLRLEDVVTREGFTRDPAKVQWFYNLRRQQLSQARPSAAHEGLAVLEAARPREILIVTGNIDDLHERAGSQAVIHPHGELMKARCMICTQVFERYDDIAEETGCPICGNKGHLRPYIVWVGDEPLGIARVVEALADAALFVAIGVAGGSELAQNFLDEARRAGARTVEFTGDFARDPAPDAGQFDERICGPFAQTVPEYVKRLIASS